MKSNANHNTGTDRHPAESVRSQCGGVISLTRCLSEFLGDFFLHCPTGGRPSGFAGIQWSITVPDLPVRLACEISVNTGSTMDLTLDSTKSRVLTRLRETPKIGPKAGGANQSPLETLDRILWHTQSLRQRATWAIQSPAWPRSAGYR